MRFGLPVRQRYYRGTREFGATLPDGRFVLVRWDAYADPRSAFSAFDHLDRARSIADGLRALRLYPGPTQNFVLADTSGSVAYQLAGNIPDDPAWARSIHPASDLARTYPNVPFDGLPRVAPSRDAIVWTANNKMYGAGYPYRLSPEFSPPYRAYRIAQLLKARARYDIAYFASMQLDTLSLPELDLARKFYRGERALRLLGGWDGRFVPSSRAATAAAELRRYLTHNVNQRIIAVLLRNREHCCETFISLPLPFVSWGVAGAVMPKHPLASLGISFLNGTTFPGDGDAFTVHVQSSGLSQSFRAVWDVGNWDAGGISIPQGESGEPGSPHYTDEAADWMAGRLLPLSYSRAAVEADARERLTLVP